MATIIATDRDGSQHTIEAEHGSSIMEILKFAGLSVEALCGGCCQCATCHVFVNEPWLSMLKPQTEFETETLEAEGSEIHPNSRLSCQIKWQDELDGIVLTVAPEA